MDSIIKIVIPGHPVVLKNSKNLVPVGITKSGKTRSIPIPNKNVAEYMERAISNIKDKLPRGFQPIDCPISLKIISFGAWKRSSENIPDASNLYQAPEDILQAAGVIVNDRQVEDHDGSRRVCMCDTCGDRGTFKAGPRKGQTRPDCGAVKKCPYERVEIDMTIL